MSGPRRGAWPANRRVVLALVPVLLGVLVLVARGDRSPGTPSRLAATATIAPLLRAAGLRPVPPALPALDERAATATATATAGLDGGPVGVTAEEPASTSGAPMTAGAAASPAADDGAPARKSPAEAERAGGTTDPVAAATAAPPAASPAAPAATAAATPAAPASTAEATTTTSTAPSTTTTTVAAAAGPARLPDVEAAVVPLTNTDRAGAGLEALARNGCLDSIASGYAQQMARNGALAHNPGAASAIAGCRPAPTWGDNVGTAKPCSASLLEDRWIASPTHRENIMTPAFRYVGVGAWTDDAGACWVQVLFSS